MHIRGKRRSSHVREVLLGLIVLPTMAILSLRPLPLRLDVALTIWMDEGGRVGCGCVTVTVLMAVLPLLIGRCFLLPLGFIAVLPPPLSIPCPSRLWRLLILQTRGAEGDGRGSRGRGELG
jgi:hypothetical protein